MSYEEFKNRVVSEVYNLVDTHGKVSSEQVSTLIENTAARFPEICPELFARGVSADIGFDQFAEATFADKLQSYNICAEESPAKSDYYLKSGYRLAIEEIVDELTGVHDTEIDGKCYLVRD